MLRGSRRALFVLQFGLFISLSVSPIAQKAAPPTFRAGTTLVEFTVVALDKKGDPVVDLKPEDLKISEDGHPRELAFFRFEGGNIAAAKNVEPLPAGLFTNRVEYTAGPPRNVTAILIDTLNTVPLEQETTRRQAIQFVKDLPDGSRVAIYGLSSRGVTVLHEFTNDRSTLNDALELSWKTLPVEPIQDVMEVRCYQEKFLQWATEVGSASSSCGMPGKKAWEYFSAATLFFKAAAERRRRDTMAALEVIGGHLAGIPGRKSLIWIGGGFSAVSMTGAMGFGKDASMTSYGDQIRDLARHLATQGIVVYPTDSRATAPASAQMRPILAGGLKKPVAGDPDAMATDPEMFQMAFVTSNDPWPTMDIVADITGGRVAKLSNDLMQGVKLAANDLRGTYTLGFYTTDQSDDRWHNLDVKATRAGVTLTHRQGYLAAAPAAAPGEWAEAEWRNAISRPVSSTAVRMDARVERVKDAPAGTLAVLVQIAADDLSFTKSGDDSSAEIDLGIAAKMPNGDARFSVTRATFSVKRDLSAGNGVVRHMRRYQIAPDTSSVVLIVRDRRTGRFGSLEIRAVQIP